MKEVKEVLLIEEGFYIEENSDGFFLCITDKKNIVKKQIDREAYNCIKRREAKHDANIVDIYNS